MDLELVLCPHTTERFLLFVWGVLLFQHVRLRIQGISVGFQPEGHRIIGFQQVGQDIQLLFQQFEVFSEHSPLDLVQFYRYLCDL